jgi:hypothetical protein
MSIFAGTTYLNEAKEAGHSDWVILVTLPAEVINHEGARLLFMADTVAEIENRSALKISRKLIFRRPCGCVAFQRY